MPKPPFTRYDNQLLCSLFDISRETLRKLLNEKYFENLVEVGYSKTSNYLTPKQYAVFTDLYGEP